MSKSINGQFKIEKRKAEVLVIGGGGAGLRAAIEAAGTGKQVVVACRSPLGRGGLTPTGNGGYHGAFWPGDSPAIHAEDLIAMGYRLNDRNLVRVLAEESVEQARLLEGFGAKINWQIPPKPTEPEMRYPRTLFIPGREMMATLGRTVKKLKNISVLQDHLALRLLVKDQVRGAVLLDLSSGGIIVCESKTTILATGSLGEIYPLTGQAPMGIPTGSTGSGYVLAGWAGADLVDMEMVQFALMPVVPPIVRGLRFLPWAQLLNGEGQAFLPPDLGAYSPDAAQAVYREIQAGRGPISMDIRGQKITPPPMRNPLSGMRIARLREFEATPSQRPVQVDVGMLYMMGGVHINERCETTVSGLYAAGEVTGNVHGARRVGGNAFPEIIVFGARAGKYAALEAMNDAYIPTAPNSQIDETVGGLADMIQGGNDGVSVKEVGQRVKTVMGRYANAVRGGKGLESALEKLEDLRKNLFSVRIDAAQGLSYNPALLAGLDARWLVEAALLVCRAALLREESRGFHFREDFPRENQGWLKHTVIRYSGEEKTGWISGTKPISLAAG